MILAIVSTDAELERSVVEDLSKRSITPVVLRGSRPMGSGPIGLGPIAEDDIADYVGRLDDLRHFLLIGVTSFDDVEQVRHRRDFRVLFLGRQPEAGSALATLHASADMRMETGGERSLAELRSFAAEAMAAFERPDWDDYFMEIAGVVARRSNCMKRKVAAVLVRDHRIISTGYNGTPRGARNCNEGGCTRCNSLTPAGTDLDECMCNHAEENAIVQAARDGVSVLNSTLYCTYSPCLHCTKLIINAGVREVIFNARYPMGQRSLDLLAECGVIARQYEPKSI